MAPAVADAAALGPLAARAVLFARDGGPPPGADPHRGVTSPEDINNKAIFALFGLIGVAFVGVGIWFFFWARNGGFYFRNSDWDDYKSTVLRRKGPNGTILSGATPSTQLGGGSVYKDVDDHSTEDATTVVSATTGITGITGGVSDFGGREKRRQKREAKERDKERRREEKAREKLTKKSRKVDADGVLVDEEAEAEAKAHLRSYRHERPARVGGLNKQSEASNFDGSTQPSHSTATESSVTSELMSDRQRTPTSTPTKTGAAAGGIRKVYSTADRTADRESERIRAEARRLQERGRAAAAGRRDFSYQRAPSSRGAGAGDAETHVPGSWTESEVGSDVGTKRYRHVIPGLSSTSAASETTDFALHEDSRRKRGASGYRRGRGEMSENGR